MKILFVVLEDFPGGDTRVRRQVAALEAAGHQVRVLCASAYSSEARFGGAPIMRTWVARRKASSFRRRAFEYLGFTLEAWLRVALMALTFRPDVVQVANMPDILVAAAWPARLLCRSKIVFDLHDLMPELFSAKASAGSAVHRAIVWQERIGVRLADRVMTVNGMCARLLAGRHAGVTPLVIPNAPDPKTFPRLAPRRAFARDGVLRVGYHGTVAARWGLGTLVRAIALLVAEGVPLTLDLWGGGEGLEDMKLLAAELGVQQHIRFHGQVKIDQLAAQLPQLDISVAPYDPDPYVEICYATKAFEAALMGIPVVVSDLPGVREQFSAAAVRYFTPGDAAALAAQIGWLYRHPAEATAQAEAAQREIAEHFDWEKIAHDYVDAVTAWPATRLLPAS